MSLFSVHWISSKVRSFAKFLFSLGCLQFRIKLQHQVKIRLILEYEEKSFVRSSKGGEANSTNGFNSSMFLQFLQWVLAGHSLGGYCNHEGPFHQSKFVMRDLGKVPLEATSAGFCVWEHVSNDVLEYVLLCLLHSCIHKLLVSLEELITNTE